MSLLQIISFYALSLIVLGTTCNFIIFYVCYNTKRNSIFMLLRYLAIYDTFTLYFWNLNHFTTANFHFNLQNFSLYSCKFGNWIQFASLQSSAWILVWSKIKSYLNVNKIYRILHFSFLFESNRKVLISIDRFLIFKIKNWKKFYFTRPVALIAGLSLSGFIFVVNSNVLFTFGYQFKSNGTLVTQCFATIPSTQWMALWNDV